jgi:hypothetical protein
LKYREKFGITPKQFDEEVGTVDFINDHVMWKIEADIEKDKQERGKTEQDNLN